MDDATRSALIRQLAPLVTQSYAPATLNVIATCLARLLKRDKGRTPIVIAWRPLYDVTAVYSFPKTFPDVIRGQEHGRLASSMQILVRLARRYFAPGCVSEMMEFFSAGLVFSKHNEAERCLGCLSLLLPHQKQQFREWLPLLLPHWELVVDHHSWDNKFMTLVARAAKASLKTDFTWDDMVQAMFSRMLVRLEITLGGSSKLVEGLTTRKEASAYHDIGEKGGVATQFAKWVVAALTPRYDDPVFAALERLLKTCETYFHPSNSGKWNSSLAAILSGLSRGLAHRHVSQNKAEKGVHASKVLRPQDRERVVRVLLRVANYAMWSKDDDMSSAARSTFKMLGYLSPQTVFEPLMEKLFFALQTVTATHQTTLALTTLGSIAHPLFSRSNYPAGAQHLVSFLQLATPGVNANDNSKTAETLKFFTSVLQWVPLVDESDNDYEPKNEYDAAAKMATSCFGDWCIMVWAQLTLYLSHLPVQEGVSYRTVWEHETVLGPFLRVFFAQMSPSFRLRFVREQIADYIARERHNNAENEVMMIITWAVSSDPVAVLPELIPHILGLMWKKGKFFDAGVQSVSWALKLLSGCAKRAGEALVGYVDQLTAVAEAAINYDRDVLENIAVRKLGAELLGTMLAGLVSFRVQDTFHVANRPNQFLYWGESVTMAEIGNKHWVAPSQASKDAAERVIRRLLAFAEEQINDEQLGDAHVQKASLALEAVLRAGQAFPFARDDVDLNVAKDRADRERGLPPYLHLKRELGCEIHQYEFVRRRVRDLTFRFHERLLERRSGSSEPFQLLLQVVESYLMCDSSDSSGMVQFQAARRWRSKARNALDKKMSSRFLLIWKSEASYLNKLPMLALNTPDTAQGRAMASIVVDLSVSPYSQVRARAQDSLFVSAITFYGVMREVILPRLVDVLLTTQSEDAAKGCLYFFDDSVILDKVKRHCTRQFLLALCKCSRFDNAKIQVLVGSVFGKFMGGAQEPEQLMTTVSSPFIDSKNRRMLERNAAIIEDMLGLAAAGLHWRYELMICVVLATKLRKDSPNVHAVRFLVERLVSDVQQIRSVAATAVTLILKQFSPRLPCEIVWQESMQAGEMYDRPWEGFSGHRFMHKKYLGSQPVGGNAEIVAIVHEFLGRPDVVDRICAFLAVDKASPANGGMKAGHAHHGMSQMLRKYGLEHMIGFGGGSDGSDAKIGLNNVHKPWPLTPVSVTMGEFHLSRTLFWKAVVKSYGGQPLPAVFFSVAESMVQPTRRREENAVAAELIAGIVRGLKSAPERLVSVLGPALVNATNDAHYDFVAMMRFAVYNRDPRCLEPLVRLVMDMPESCVNSSSALAKSLRYVDALVVEFDWRLEHEYDRLFRMLMSLVGYDYGQVRLAVAGVLFHLASVGISRIDFEPVLHCIKPEDDAPAVSRKRETVLVFLAHTVRAQLIRRASFHKPLLEFVFAAHGDPEKDVSILAKNLTPTQALTVFSGAALDEIQDKLAALATTGGWKARAAIPLVVTLLDFNHRFVPRQKSFAFLIDQLMLDSHVEVRTVAELALRSMLTGQADEVAVREVDSKCSLWIEAKSVHSAVLAYSAVVLAFPYTVPGFVEPILEKLVGYASAPAPVGSSVKHTIAEFWRTHRDVAESETILQDAELLRTVRGLGYHSNYFA